MINVACVRCAQGRHSLMVFIAGEPGAQQDLLGPSGPCLCVEEGSSLWPFVLLGGRHDEMKHGAAVVRIHSGLRKFIRIEHQVICIFS